ncbi:hypothetical protein [Paenibacillus sp. BR1-192]|uniref:hypothetical protein n=1 Tax=Paenibacillus sp. BR1-192 TaxID=3032287 RepID=UPI00240CFE10|nr:hypothetical protein [Paenibacillus sp. BR1-192]WFB57338.1 hypothetical protein P0X86_25725 [Paenibacillus sp. BR1-192]
MSYRRHPQQAGALLQFTRKPEISGVYMVAGLCLWSRRRDHDENARLGLPEWQSIKTSLRSSISAFILESAAARWMSRRAFVGRTAGETQLMLLPMVVGFPSANGTERKQMDPSCRRSARQAYRRSFWLLPEV